MSMIIIADLEKSCELDERTLNNTRGGSYFLDSYGYGGLDYGFGGYDFGYGGYDYGFDSVFGNNPYYLGGYYGSGFYGDYTPGSMDLFNYNSGLSDARQDSIIDSIWA